LYFSFLLYLILFNLNMSNIIIFTILFFFSPVIYGLACTQQYQCSGVTTNYNYVQCVAGQCACLASNGFNGTATTSDPCRCDYTVAWGTSQPFCMICNSPRYIDYYQGNPYCLNAPECQTLEAASDTGAIRLAVIEKLYNQLIYPTPLLIMAGEISVADIFASNVKGRVSPVGSYNDFTSVQEYFYALAAVSDITQVTMQKITVTGNYVTVSVIIYFNNAGRGTPSYNLTQAGFFTFNEQNLVSSLDLDILNLGWALDGDSATNPATRLANIQNICTTLVVSPGYCPPSEDPSGYYSSFADCVNYMSNITYGSWSHANSNTVICRSLHTILTAFRPSVHCPHAGKTGGGVCIDTPYASFYDEEF